MVKRVSSPRWASYQAVSCSSVVGRGGSAPSVRRAPKSLIQRWYTERRSRRWGPRAMRSPTTLTIGASTPAVSAVMWPPAPSRVYSCDVQPHLQSVASVLWIRSAFVQRGNVTAGSFHASRGLLAQVFGFGQFPGGPEDAFGKGGVGVQGVSD